MSDTGGALSAMAEEIRKVEDGLTVRPILRQGHVTAKAAGPPMLLTVDFDEGSYPQVYSVDSTIVSGDTIWVLVLPGGVRLALGRLK